MRSTAWERLNGGGLTVGENWLLDYVEEALHISGSSIDVRSTFKGETMRVTATRSLDEIFASLYRHDGEVLLLRKAVSA